MISNGQNNQQPLLYGLVLAGGKSVRMGQDKGAINWHGKEQRYYMADMLMQVCSSVFISCREEQLNEVNPEYTTLLDSYEGAGPIIAILSAFKAYPDAAWLVAACDLPLLDLPTLQYLIQHRNTSKIATTFQSPFDTLPEPLITIWEPQSRPLLQAYFDDNFKCPRKLLIRNQDRVNVLIPQNPNAVMNANTPEDARKVEELIAAKK